MYYKLNPDKCATLIRATLGMQRRKQIDLARELGIGKVLLNMYLNRKLDLLPEHIEIALDSLGIKKQAERLTGLNNERQNT